MIVLRTSDNNGKAEELNLQNVVIKTTRIKIFVLITCRIITLLIISNSNVNKGD